MTSSVKVNISVVEYTSIVGWFFNEVETEVRINASSQIVMVISHFDFTLIY